MNDLSYSSLASIIERLWDGKNGNPLAFEALLLHRRPGLYFYPQVHAGWFDAVKFISQRPVQVENTDVDHEIKHGEGASEVEEDVLVEETADLHVTINVESELEDEGRLEEASRNTSLGPIRSEWMGENDAKQGVDEAKVKLRLGNDVLFSHENFYHCPFFGNILRQGFLGATNGSVMIMPRPWISN